MSNTLHSLNASTSTCASTTLDRNTALLLLTSLLDLYHASMLATKLQEERRIHIISLTNHHVQMCQGWHYPGEEQLKQLWSLKETVAQHSTDLW